MSGGRDDHWIQSLYRRLDVEVAGSGDESLAWGLVLVAALSTVLGACLMFLNLRKEYENTFTACSLAAAAGVMLYTCLVELFNKSVTSFEEGGYTRDDGAEAYRAATLCFFIGAIFFYFVMLIAHAMKPPEQPSLQSSEKAAVDEHASIDKVVIEVDQNDAVSAATLSSDAKANRSLNMGFKAALAISLHNLPEGLAGWLTTYSDSRSGMNICFGIILHNIPEGLCVALPIYSATGSRIKALAWASIAGFAEIVGGVLAQIFVHGYGVDELHILYGTCFGLVNGMMTAVVVFEFIPHAAEIEPSCRVWPVFFILGMAVLSATLLTESL